MSYKSITKKIMCTFLNIHEWNYNWATKCIVWDSLGGPTSRKCNHCGEYQRCYIGSGWKTRNEYDYLTDLEKYRKPMEDALAEVLKEGLNVKK